MKLIRKISLLVLSAAMLFAILRIPLKTRQGIDGVVATKKIPLYAKVCGYLYRDYQYKDLSSYIVKGIRGDDDKVMAIYIWTTDNIKKPPKAFKIVDDHIWDIIVRGYGSDDQMADVFATLVSYVGYEAFWEKLNARGASHSLILSFVKIGGKWFVFDVYNRRPFMTNDDLSLPAPDGTAYNEYMMSMDKTKFDRRVRRPDKQKLLPRLAYELKVFFGGGE